MSTVPWPLLPGELQAICAELEGGVPFQGAFERLLLGLPLERAEALMLLHREGRGAWAALLERRGGRVLCVGNALSGTFAALSRLGFAAVLLDRSAERLRLGVLRIRAQGGRAEGILSGEGPRLPFRDAVFELAVQEPALSEEEGSPSPEPGELARVARAVACVAENRFGYKRSRARRGSYRLLGPRELARRLLAPERGERGLAGHRRALGATRAFALYPHSQDWTHAVSLDARLPTLRIGPKERRNRLKLLAWSAGLFPWLAPSYLLLRGEAGGEPARRLLDAVSERVGERELELEELVATRGNCALFLTRGRGDPTPGSPGRLAIHLPLNPHKRRMMERHARALAALRERFPALPIPELRFAGEVEGIWCVCERRLEGLSAAQLSGDRARVRRTLEELALALEGLLVAPPRPLSAEDFERELGEKFALVAERCGERGTRQRLDRMRSEARERLVGLSLPRVLAHCDLRSKHVQVDADGGLLGILDWGTSEQSGLPAFDLLHFLLHEWKQAEGESPGSAWRRWREEGARDPFAQALMERHAAALGLDPESRAALEAIHPILVGAAAERTWDYSRPRWIHRAYGL